MLTGACARGIWKIGGEKGEDPSPPGWLLSSLATRALIGPFRTWTYNLVLFPSSLCSHSFSLGSFHASSMLCVCQSLSCVRLFATPWTVAYQASLCPWDSPRKNTGAGCHGLPFSRGSSRPQGLNPGLKHCGWTLYHLSHQESRQLPCLTEHLKIWTFFTSRHLWLPPLSLTWEGKVG